MKIRASLKNILTVNFVLFATLPMLAIGFIALHILTTSMEKEIANKNFLLAKSLASEVERFLEEPLRLLYQIQDVVDGKGLILNYINSYLDSVISNYTFFDMIMITDHWGAVKQLAPYNKDFVDIDMSGHTFFRKTRESRQPYWSPTFISMQTSHPTLTVSIRTALNLIIGYLNLSTLNSMIEKVKIGTEGYAAITDRDGIVIAHPNPSFVSQRLSIQSFYPVQQAMQGREGTFEYSIEGIDRLGSVIIIPHTGWIVAVIQPVGEAYASVRKIRFVLWVGIVVALVLACITALIILRKTLQPLVQLTKHSQKIADGDYDLFSWQGSYLEVEELAQNFNVMVEAVKFRENALRDSEETMRRLQNLLSNIINSMPSVLVGVTPDGKVTQWNRKAEELTGIMADNVQGRLLPEVLPPQLAEEIKRVDQAIQERKLYKDEKVPWKHGNELRYCDITIYPLIDHGIEGAVIQIDDVTERVYIEEMMIQTEKMMTVGGLAAGMAHEINNPLGIILQAIQNTFRRLSPELVKNIQVAQECGIDLDRMRLYLEQRHILAYLKGVQDAGQRAAKIVANMLSFSRRGEADKESIDLNQLLEKSLELATSDYDLKKKYDFRHIKIIREYHSTLPQVPCVSLEVEQVILNLLKNAAQALAEKREVSYTPQIRIRTQKDSSYAMICIEDNGPGMDEYTIKRIFEPFFTTKAIGTGTGLGLSVSYFIIETHHNGKITVDSTLGEGTKFMIRLPFIAGTR